MKTNEAAGTTLTSRPAILSPLEKDPMLSEEFPDEPESEPGPVDLIQAARE